MLCLIRSPLQPASNSARAKIAKMRIGLTLKMHQSAIPATPYVVRSAERSLADPALVEGGESMREFVVGLLALWLGAGVARGQTDQEMRWALGEVGEELQTCSVYFAVISGCVGQQRPDLSDTYQQAAQRLALLGASGKQSAGVSQDAILAFQKLMFADMKKSMGGNCTNIAVLLNKYKDFCQRLSQNADPRLKEWIQCIRAKQQVLPVEHNMFGGALPLKAVYRLASQGFEIVLLPLPK
jgi:hypothetical protein